MGLRKFWRNYRKKTNHVVFDLDETMDLPANESLAENQSYTRMQCKKCGKWMRPRGLFAHHGICKGDV